MKKVIFTGIFAICATSTIMANRAIQPINSRMAPAIFSVKEEKDVCSAFKIDTDITINGKTYHVQGEASISFKDKSVTMDITIITPDGKTLRFNGTIYFTNAGASVINGILTDENGKIVSIGEYRDLLEEIAAQLLHDNVSIIDGVMTNEKGDTVEIVPYAELLLRLANHIMQEKQ